MDATAGETAPDLATDLKLEVQVKHYSDHQRDEKWYPLFVVPRKEDQGDKAYRRYAQTEADRMAGARSYGRPCRVVEVR